MAAEPDPNLASIDEWGHVGYDLALETEAYQAYREGWRAACEADDGSSESVAHVEAMHQDMLKAKAVMETTWLRMKPTTS